MHANTHTHALTNTRPNVLYASSTLVAAFGHKSVLTKLWLSVVGVSLWQLSHETHTHIYTQFYGPVSKCVPQQALQHIESLLIRINDNCSPRLTAQTAFTAAGYFERQLDGAKEFFQNVNGFSTIWIDL